MNSINLDQLIRDPYFGTIAVVIAVWSLIWKGLALWRAGRLNDKGWFIALLLLNTLGLLEILYLTIFSKRNSKPDQS